MQLVGGGGFAERKKETLNLKLNTKPLKFKWGLAKWGGGGAGWSTHGYPHLVFNNLGVGVTISNFRRSKQEIESFYKIYQEIKTFFFLQN